MLYLWNEVDEPQFFCISGISNSLSAANILKNLLTGIFVQTKNIVQIVNIIKELLQGNIHCFLVLLCMSFSASLYHLSRDDDENPQKILSAELKR